MPCYAAFKRQRRHGALQIPPLLSPPLPPPLPNCPMVLLRSRRECVAEGPHHEDGAPEDSDRLQQALRAVQKCGLVCRRRMRHRWKANNSNYGETATCKQVASSKEAEAHQVR